MSTTGPDSLGAYLEGAIRDGLTPGAVAWVREGERVLHRSAHGMAEVAPEPRPMRLDTPFDLASLTKPLATALLAVTLGPELGLRPETPAGRLLAELDDLDHREITLRHLLTHTSGLPAWRPLFLHGEDVHGFLRRLREEPLAAPTGGRVLYSDPGYMAAGEMVARAAGAPLDELFREAIAAPSGAAVGFRPDAASAARAAATEDGQEFERDLAGAEGEGYRGFREGRIRGEVHDHHAWIAGGVLGSAGLFADAAALDALARELLEPGGLRLPGEARERLTARREKAPGEPRSEGFILNLGGDSSGGPSLERSAFGHTGFTGTSLWIEPGRGRLYILLTNRIHPRVRQVDMLAFRQGFHRVAAALPAGR